MVIIINGRSIVRFIEIKKIAFYRARYVENEYINLSYFDKKQIDTIKKKLKSYFAKNTNFNRSMIKNLHILEELSNAK